MFTGLVQSLGVVRQIAPEGPGVRLVIADESIAQQAKIGDSIAIRAKRRGRSARLAVDVPVGTDVNIKGASLDVAARGALGALRVRSASGDVRIDRWLGASLAIASMSGDLVVRMPGGQRVDADISTLSGSLSLPDRAPQSDEPKKTVRLRLKTVSGDIRVERL